MSLEKTLPGQSPRFVLILNAGSSSIKFALFPLDASTTTFSGKIQRIGLSDALFTSNISGHPHESFSVDAPDHGAAGEVLIRWLGGKIAFHDIAAIGHRIVHGFNYRDPQIITPELVAELRRISPFAPQHLPGEIQLIEAFQRRDPGITQVACFDTAFHRDMPRVARILPIPRKYDAKGIQRYGFHGLSYTYLMEELERVGGNTAAKGRVILAHLGNGASIAAVRGGRSIDTSMGFTPMAGVPMSTRSGDLDPGLVRYLMDNESMNAAAFDHMAGEESGLLGISEISPDMRDLLARENNDMRAAEAIECFCYQVKKWIGGFAAALGGLDTLVFSAGIGENLPAIRSRICAGLNFLGVELDSRKNENNDAVISQGRVVVRVIATNEELVILRAVKRLI